MAGPGLLRLPNEEAQHHRRQGQHSQVDGLRPAGSQQAPLVHTGLVQAVPGKGGQEPQNGGGDEQIGFLHGGDLLYITRRAAIAATIAARTG